MNAQQYRDALERLGWTQARAAEELGIDARTSRRYALGECPVPGPVEKLLEMLIRDRAMSDAKVKRPVRSDLVMRERSPIKSGSK